MDPRERTKQPMDPRGHKKQGGGEADLQGEAHRLEMEISPGPRDGTSTLACFVLGAILLACRQLRQLHLHLARDTQGAFPVVVKSLSLCKGLADLSLRCAFPITKDALHPIR